MKKQTDMVDLDSMPTPLCIGFMQLAEFVEAGLKEDAISPADRAGIAC